MRRRSPGTLWRVFIGLMIATGAMWLVDRPEIVDEQLSIFLSTFGIGFMIWAAITYGQGK